MKRNPIFKYNNIDEQKLVYANQLTVKDWNRIINYLKEQANANTTYLETWTRWFFGPLDFYTEDEYTDSLDPYTCYYDYLKAEFNRIDKRIDDEESARKSADSTLQSNINAETQARKDEDTLIRNTINADREASISRDNTLQSNINVVDNKANANATEIGTTKERLTDLERLHRDDMEVIDNEIENAKQRLNNLHGRQTTLFTKVDELQQKDAELSGDIYDLTQRTVVLEGNTIDLINGLSEVADSKLDKNWDNISELTNLSESNYIVINTSNGAYKVKVEKFRDMISQTVNYFKGYFPSYDELISSLSSIQPKKGDYAFVNTTDENGDLLIMYIWDDDANEWSETNSTQYATIRDLSVVRDLARENANKLANLDVDLSASNIYFEDGESLQDKYLNGELGSGGGGGGSVVDDLVLTAISNDTLTTATGKPIKLQYNFIRENNPTKSGIECVIIDGNVVSTRNVNQGNVIADINGLTRGTHFIEITVTSSGLTSSLVFTADVIELSITSTFDGFAVHGTNVVFPYTPVGNVEKTIYFKVNGVIEATTIVLESNKRMTYDLTFSHGSYKLEVYMSANVGEDTITSNTLSYDVVVDGGESEPLIGCPFNITKATQGDLLTFEYIAFTPGSLTTDINLMIDDTVVNTLTVDRTKQVWALREYPAGDVEFKIVVVNNGISSTTKTFPVTVTELSLNVEAATQNLELYLTSKGRSNNEDASIRNVWENNNIKAEFTNFNWKSNGWINDVNSDVALRINGNASVVIPIKLFKNDFRGIGKTIEFEFSTHDIRNYDSVLIDCMSNNRGFSLTSNVARLKSEQTTVETKFKEDEKVRVAFVVEPTSENRLIYTYINGVMSGLQQYPSDDDFTQSTPINITIGSPNATIDLYNIRIYNINLDHIDVLNNYIADTPDINKKKELYNSNNIFDSYGDINYEKVLDKLPCLTFIGELPGSKGNKKIVDIIYTNKENSSKDFKEQGVEMDIQGTSSQYYPRKNYKFELNNAYKLTDRSIPEYVFCLKADYMESSHSHNTGLAKIVNVLYPVTPGKQQDSRVQAAITGFPIVVWHKENENAIAKCLGVYNFNNDKDDTHTWGYTESSPQCESWEFRNNTSAHCLFQTDNFTDTVEVAKNFEARYPDKYKNYTALSRVVSWVYSTRNNLQKFKNEFNTYFNLESTLLYYCLTELFAMVDSRAKNLFLTTWDGLIWYPTFYDMDTAFGLNNEGVNDFEYSVEYHDVKGTQNVFNGESSVLWNNFEQAFEQEIAEFYVNLRDKDKVTYESVMDILYGEQISKIAENNYNYDAIEKYKNPLVEDNIGTYLYVAQGSRIDHLKRWLYNRINYMDSKYLASDFKEDYITLRIYTPSNYDSVTPNADAHITPYRDQYVVVKYDENIFDERGTHNVETTITAPEQVFNDTPMIIYGASGISSIGDLSPLYAGTVDVSSGVKLKELIIGNSNSNYKNENLKNLTIGNNELLTKLDVRNCSGLTADIDASGCTNIEEIYATGTSSTSVKVPNGGNLKKLYLPETVTSIAILNQPFLTDYRCENYNLLSTLRVENTPINTLAIVQLAPNLSRIRLVNVDWTISNSNVLKKIMRCNGLKEDGGNQDKAVLTGKVHITGSVSTTELSMFNAYFGTGLSITADNLIFTYTVTFKNYDGTILEEAYVERGKNAVYSGEIPIKENDENYKYEFSGWDKPLTNITADTIFTAQFTTIDLFLIQWCNYDGTVLQTNKADIGAIVSYTGELPVRPDDVQYKDYLFNNWIDAEGNVYVNNVTVTGNMTLTARFLGSLQTYDVYWYNGDELLEFDQGVPYGEIAEYNGEIPVHEEGYMFIGWSRTSGSNNADADFTITGDTTFYPAYDKPDEITFICDRGIASPNLTLTSCTGVDEEITIDWGNEEVSTYTVTTSGTKCAPSKYYYNGNYTIKLPSTENYKITSVYRAGLKITSASFKYWRISATSFFDSSMLTNFSLPLVSSKIGLTDIPETTFQLCHNLTNVTIPEGFTRVGTRAFNVCTSLTSIHIPSSITSFGNYPFGGCTSLTSITVDENNTVYDSRNNCNAIIKTNGDYLIVGCLTTVIPNNVKSLSNYAFYKLSNLTSIEIPNGVEQFGLYVFEGCTSLTRLTIPSSVKKIDVGCTPGSSSNKATIIFESETPPTIYQSTFNTSKLQEIRVPVSAVETYKSATNWAAFADYIVGYEEE